MHFSMAPPPPPPPHHHHHNRFHKSGKKHQQCGACTCACRAVVGIMVLLWIHGAIMMVLLLFLPLSTKEEGPILLLAGLVQDKLSDTAWDYLWELNCRHSVHIHIMATHPSQLLAEKAKRFPCRRKTSRVVSSRQTHWHAASQGQAYSSSSSSSSSSSPWWSSSSEALFIILPDPPSLGSHHSNRIDRLTALRNYQREWLRPLMTTFILSRLVVVVADLDLQQFVAPALLRQVEFPNDMQVLCSRGMMHRPYGYYDAFATVLQDGSFLYPQHARKYFSHFHDSSFQAPSIRSSDVLGDFTQADFGLLLQQAPVTPVQSCFGGTALYQGRAFFEPSCSYTLSSPPPPPPASDSSSSTTTTLADPLWTYANVEDERVCEHVVFHSCLRRAHHDDKDIIGISSQLVTQWDAPLEESFTIQAGGYLSEGLVGRFVPHADGLLLWNRDLARQHLTRRGGDFGGFSTSPAPQTTTRTTTTTTTTTRSSHEDLFWQSMTPPLRNGDYQLQINPDTGRLQLTRKSNNNNQPQVVVWTSTPAPIGFLPRQWMYLALFVSHDGVLVLVQQHVPSSPLPEDKCVRVEASSSPSSLTCRSIIWTSGVRGIRRHPDYSLVLTSQGELYIRDDLHQTIVWTADPTKTPMENKEEHQHPH